MSSTQTVINEDFSSDFLESRREDSSFSLVVYPVFLQVCQSSLSLASLTEGGDAGTFQMGQQFFITAF